MSFLQSGQYSCFLAGLTAGFGFSTLFWDEGCVTLVEDDALDDAERTLRVDVLRLRDGGGRRYGVDPGGASVGVAVEA